MKNALNSSSHLALLARLGSLATASTLLGLSANAVVPNDSLTPGQIRDYGVTGIGQQLSEFGADCTGTLINPRMVIWAGHCVSDYDAKEYGHPSKPIGFAFEDNAEDGYDSWRQNGFQTDESNFVYNVNQVQRHPNYIDSDHNDLALGTLDTPASNVPNWGVLFSPLPTPEEIDPTNGTGYHVNIIGYGNTGSGTDGDDESGNFRRRAAENMLGGLTSYERLEDFRNYSRSARQGFRYYVDFDDPLGQDVYDRNYFRDEGLPNEGFGGKGDSGGPLILDAANNQITTEDLVLGVYSTSYRRGQRNGYSTYGTYQPLFLLWDWIVEANPYRYVSTKGGDGDWGDADHWVTLLDPSYRYIDENGNIVNGIPNRRGLAHLASGPGFGEFCYQAHPRNPDPDLNNCASAGDPNAPNNWWRNEPLPDPTLDNGLPGASNFVPDNIDPNLRNLYPDPDTNGRYFDVTLNRGTTRVKQQYEIDRLTLRGGAKLDLHDTGDLTSLIDITQRDRASLFVNGILSTPTFNMEGGLLQGTGTIRTSTFKNKAGAIMPGDRLSTTPGEMLTIDGNVELSGGSRLFFFVRNDDVDLLNVTGDIDLDGALILQGAYEYGDTFSVIQFGGTATNEFNHIELWDENWRLPEGVLYYQLVEQGNLISFDILASPLAEHLPDNSSANEIAIAKSLDTSREEYYTALEDLYRSIDSLDSRSLSRAFKQLVPADANLMGQALTETGMALDLEVSTRLKNIRQNGAGYTLSGSTQMLEEGRRSSANSRPLEQIMFGQNSATSEKSARTNGFGGFATISVLDSDSTINLSQTSADMRGYSISAGVDKALQNGAVIGLMASHSRAANGVGERLTATDEQVIGSSFGLYGTTPVFKDYFADAHLSFGEYSTQSGRTASLAATPESISAEAQTKAVITGVTFGRQFELENGVNLTPHLGVLSTRYEIGDYTEQGSFAALDIESRTLTSTQLRLGADIDWSVGEHENIRPAMSVSLVNDLDAKPDQIRSRFAGAPGSTEILFTGERTPSSWGELNASVAFQITPAQSGSFGLRQTVSRGFSPETLVGGSYRVKF